MNAGLVQGLYERFQATIADQFAGGWHLGRAEFDGHVTYPYIVVQGTLSLGPDYTTGSHEHGQSVTEPESVSFMVFSPVDTEAARLARLVERTFVRDVMRNKIQWVDGDERGHTMRAHKVSGTQYEDPDKETDGEYTGRTIWTAVRVIEFLTERST